METGFLFAILTAAAFALSQVMIRRATYQSEESFTAVAVSALIGTPIFVILLTIFGEWSAFISFTWSQYILLAAAGLVHLIIARFLFFNSTRIIGANPTVAITRTSIVFSVVFGVVFLGESVTVLQGFAALIIMVGAILTNTEITRTTFRISTKGLLMGFGTAISSATSAALIRPVMQETDAVYAATFVMYLTAYVAILLILMSSRKQRTFVLHQDRRTFIILALSAVILVAGHLCRFTALQHSPVSIVQPIIATIVIFVLLFSWMANRRIDVFNWRVIAGIVMVLLGVYLIYY
jgi:drug/metabolite transporter (DMT)-like permease